MDLKAHPYFKLFYKVQKPARYLGRESGSIFKKNAKIRMVFCFPEVYEIAMSNTGIKILYEKVNSIPEISMERCFAPWTDMEEELKEKNIPLISLESLRPLYEFDVVGFSLSYELTYTNILTMLSLGRIPFFASKRKSSFPIIIAGGQGANNPEPLSCFIDLFLIGDGEELLPNFLLKLKELKEKSLKKNEIIRELSKIDGVYSPHLEQFHGLIRTQKIEIEKHPFPLNSIIPYVKGVFQRTSIEIVRGCMQGCRFCQAGYLYRPTRERSIEEIFSTIEKYVEKNGEEEVSLMSLSSADYSCLKPLVTLLMDYLLKKNVTLSISSLRAYGVDKEVLSAISKLRKIGLTFAPEAGNERMRKIINKNVSEQEFLEGVEIAFSSGWQKIKLYFIIGLPLEKDEDLLSICELSKKVLKIGEKYHGKKIKVTVSVSSFVPKPHTPFQWLKMDSIEEILRKQKILKDNLRIKGIELKWHNAYMSVIECVFSRGDKRLGEVLLKAWQKGCRFDGWEDMFSWDKWLQAFEECNIDINDYLKEIPLKSPLPWDKIDIGIDKSFLIDELKRAFKELSLPSCATIRNKKIICYHCGLSCNLEKFKEQKIAIINRIKAAKKTVFESTIENKFSLYQINFAKIESASLISHLDFVKIFPLILRSAGFELKYSKGFHPLPAISYENPLPFGYRSLSEKAVVEMRKKNDIDSLLKKLNEVSLHGLIFISIKELKERNIFKEKPFITYFVSIEDFEEEKLKEKIENILKNNEIFIDFIRDEKNLRINILPYIESLEISDTDLIKGGNLLSKKERGIIIKIKRNKEKIPKPLEIVEKLFHIKLLPYQIIRI